MKNNELFILSFLTIAILVSLILLLAYLIIRKAIDLKKRRMLESHKEKYNKLIFEMLTDSSFSCDLKPETTLQRKSIEELLSHYAKIVEGEYERNRLSEIAERYLLDYYRKGIKSKRWSQRMNALYHIEDFNVRQLTQEVIKLIDKKHTSHEEIIHVLRILATFQFPRNFEFLTERYSYLSTYEYRTILLRLQEDQFNQFVRSFHKSLLPLQMAILDVISIKKDKKYISMIENVFSVYSGEVKLRALKTLAELGYVHNIDPYIKLLYSSKWEERMIAAKLIGSLKEEKGVPRLIELLHDQTWWVRSQAGQAICQFPNGKDILLQVLETSKDAFAKDMAWEWLHKGV
jgi:hypothetical protein